jgi:hypothetical protein
MAEAQDQVVETVVQANAEQEEIVVTKSAEELAKRLKEVSLEAKINRQKYSDEKKKREELEKQKLQESGQYKELSEIRTREAADARSQTNKLREAFVLKTVSDTLALEAQKMGCIDTDALINLLPLNQVPIDEVFNVDRDSVRAILDDFRKSKPYFFQKPAPRIADANPAKVEAPVFDLNKLTLGEKAALLSQLNKQGK